MQRRLRLRRGADFDRLRRRGKVWHHPLILLIAGVNELEYSRFGFSARRGFGKAIARNRVKRVLREVVRSQLSYIEKGWDCLFVAKRAANDASYEEVEAAVLQLLKRSSLLQPRTEMRVPAAENEALT
jgi:ribonuclease P protein component